MNTKQKGTVGIGEAIAYFTRNNIVVSIPLNDSQGYDLIADMPEGLKRIDTKVTTYKSPGGKYMVSTKTTGGNRSRNTVTHFDPRKCDFVFAHTPDTGSFLIPSEVCTKNAITLSKEYMKYKVTDANLLMSR